MKIIHVIPDLKKGGAERLCLDICRVLNHYREHEVLLINFRHDNAYPFLTDDINRRIIPAQFTPSIKGIHHRDLGALQSTIDAFNPDVIHVHLFESLVVVSQLDHKAHLIVHFHDNMVQLENFSLKTIFSKKKVTNYYEKRIVLKGLEGHQVTYIGISNDTFAFIEKVLPKNARKTKLLNAIDIKRFKNPNFINSEEEIAGNHLEITMIGSLVEKKGQSLAIETISVLKKRGLSVMLHLLGDGPKRTELELLAQTLDVKELILFHGNVDFPEEYLWRSILYLHTAKYEPFGLVFLEAMAASLPLVTTDGFGNRELVTNNFNGFFVPNREPEQIADKVRKIVSSEELRKTFANNSSLFVQKFDITQYVKRILTIYESK